MPNAFGWCLILAAVLAIVAIWWSSDRADLKRKLASMRGSRDMWEASYQRQQKQLDEVFQQRDKAQTELIGIVDFLCERGIRVTRAKEPAKWELELGPQACVRDTPTAAIDASAVTPEALKHAWEQADRWSGDFYELTNLLRAKGFEVRAVQTPKFEIVPIEAVKTSP